MEELDFYVSEDLDKPTELSDVQEKATKVYDELENAME